MIKDTLKDGWRRTKQTTKVKLGKADETHDDEDYDQLVVQCKEHHALAKKVHASIVAHVSALKLATSSGAALAHELNELYSDVSAEHRPAVVANTQAWQEAGALSIRQLEQVVDDAVLEPLKAHLAEFDKVADLWEHRRKRRQDFDYYRGKTTELEKKRGEKNMDEKISRNAFKLEQSRQIFLALTEEVRARMRELMSERFAFYGGPLTQVLAMQRNYFGGVFTAFAPFAKWTSEQALASAKNAMDARPSRRRAMLTVEQIVAGEMGADAGQDKGWAAEDDHQANPPVVSMEELHAQRAPTAAATQPAAAPAPSAFATPEADPWGQSELQQHAQPAAQPQPVVDLLGGSSDPFAAPAQQQQQQPQQQQPSAPVDLFGAAPVAGEKYKALTDYAPGDPRMLALKKGDLLTKEKEEDGWFFGSNDRGQSGYFPPNYCKKV
ncbi:hypothetical protein KFE25_006994 [Diacronema lutheri]|uniref:SH3 domain-containing protein n=2 Tax=Diacronema lutheri TaxID=2081491 RepID=A0A8J5XT65_DIALT|nr:hypothetical protein KFE25_006994 [Diacronema lutheri]